MRKVHEYKFIVFDNANSEPMQYPDNELPRHGDFISFNGYFGYVYEIKRYFKDKKCDIYIFVGAKTKCFNIKFLE